MIEKIRFRMQGGGVQGRGCEGRGERRRAGVTGAHMHEKVFSSHINLKKRVFPTY